MILFLTLVLLFLMITIGGERGAVSIMALAGNIIILFFSVILMSAGFPALLLILAAGAGVCYNSLFYQNGNNVKTRAAFLATLFVMLILFIPIFATRCFWPPESCLGLALMYGAIPTFSR